uniref:Ionotropic receptor n=1 Tax=Anopheles stephensi TaxID=30069 RepID=A0A182Y4K4_ANOST
MSRWSYALAVMSCLTVQAARQADITAYVSHYAYTLQMQHWGVFNCWILQFYTKSTHSSMVDAVARQLNAHHISVLQSDHRATHVPIFREPNMVILLWGNHAQTVASFNTHWWISSIPPDCPTIVLFERESVMQPWLIGAYFAPRLVYYIALIALNVDALYTFHYEPFRLQTLSGFPSYSELFFDRLQTLQTKKLTAVYISDYYTVLFCNNLYGEDIALFNQFAETLQFAITFREIQCSRNETIDHCISRSSDAHLIVNRLYLIHYSKYAVCRASMEQITIATPKGRLLTVWEILLKPFQPPAWTMMLAILVACQLAQQLAPALFVNNLLSLALFGFEKRRLRLTKFGEKVTACALIILFFQLKCAYEAKLVSYLTETPRIPDALSIEALRARNITVYRGKINIDHVDKLDGMVAQYEGSRIVFDGSTFLENREALMVEQLLSDSVDNHGISYTILPDNVFEILPFYVFPIKSLFGKRFHTYQQRVFEAGMQQHWRQEHLNCFLLHIVNMHHDRRDHAGANAAIRYDHLKPLLLFFLAQWTTALLVFLGETVLGSTPPSVNNASARIGENTTRR